MATMLKGDCLAVMKTMPARSVDCFIVDLPYGCLSGGASKCPWDVKIDLVEFWAQVKRLCRDDHTPVLMFCNTRFGYELIKSNEKWFRYDLVWNKMRGVSYLSANKMPLKSHEMVYVFAKAGARYNRVDYTGFKGWGAKDNADDVTKNQPRCYGNTKGKKWVLNENKGTRCATSVIDVTRGGNSKDKHPTEKPDELYEWLLRRYCPTNGTVLDPTAGSFNSVFTARRLGFKAIGIEMDNDFFYRALARLLKVKQVENVLVDENVITHV